MKGSLTTIRNNYQVCWFGKVVLYSDHQLTTQITAVTFGDSAEQIFYGGIDCSIHVGAIVYTGFQNYNSLNLLPFDLNPFNSALIFANLVRMCSNYKGTSILSQV